MLRAIVVPFEMHAESRSSPRRVASVAHPRATLAGPRATRHHADVGPRRAMPIDCAYTMMPA